MIARAEADVLRTVSFFSPVVASLSWREYGPAPGPLGRAGDWLLACTLSVATCEILQFTALTLIGWLVDAGCPRPGWRLLLPGTAPVTAAAYAALATRPSTRALRFLAEAHTARQFLRTLRGRRVSDRPTFAARRVLMVTAGAACLVGLLAVTDARLLPPSAWASPAARLCAGAYAATVGPLGQATRLSFLSFLPSPGDVGRAVDAFCGALTQTAGNLGAAAAHLATIARRVTPLRALLDLTEMDAWATTQAAAAWARLYRALPPPLLATVSDFGWAASAVAIGCADVILTAGRALAAHLLGGGG
jgi:hypothetical protein